MNHYFDNENSLHCQRWDWDGFFHLCCHISCLYISTCFYPCISLEEHEMNSVGKWESWKEYRPGRDLTRFDSGRIIHSCCQDADGEGWDKKWSKRFKWLRQFPGEKLWDLEQRPWLWVQGILKKWNSFTMSGHMWWLWSTTGPPSVWPGSL